MSDSIREVFETLLHSNEIRKVDFKSDQYRLDIDYLKSKFAKDILCIANSQWPIRRGRVTTNSSVQLNT